MSEINENQPLGTPTWLDLHVPAPDQAREYYGTLFGWDYADGFFLLRGRQVAGLKEGVGGWRVHLATDDCDVTAKAVEQAGGTIEQAPHEVGELGRAALFTDAVGVTVGLWQGRSFPGYRLANEPNTVVRNDLVTDRPAEARDFYAKVFGFTLDGNEDMPGFDFTFLRRPDGHEIGGIMGVPGAQSGWNTCFEVSDTDATLALTGTDAVAEETPYGRSATFHDPFGVEVSIIARP